MPALRTDGLTKKYGSLTAVDSLDMTVKEGEIFGFLGPNGAGKTTTIDVLLGYTYPTSGTSEVLGRPSEDESARERVGVMPEDFGLYSRLTAKEHIDFVAESKDVKADTDALLERVGLEDSKKRRVGGYSKGMKKRLLLATALVGEPDLLVLDEPTGGLDPNGARRIREIVKDVNERGATVFFSSHILGQVEAVCDRVGIMREGRLVAVDSIEGLRDGVDSVSRLKVTVEGTPDVSAFDVRSMDGVSDVSVENDTVTFSCLRPKAKLDAFDAVRGTHEVHDFTTEESSLDDLFAAYAGDGETDDTAGEA
ncbi:MAG: ABC transporter ATP-binding protein [Halobacteriales archaeon]|nr:ABC transporter ATP-binding protein [Halobacteriales archaeon]